MAAAALSFVTEKLKGLVMSAGEDRRDRFPAHSLEACLLRATHGNVIIAGGAVIGHELEGIQPLGPQESDVDVWIFGKDKDHRVEAAQHICDVLRGFDPDIMVKKRGPSVLTFYSDRLPLPIQVIMTEHATANDVVARFDLDACRGYYEWDDAAGGVQLFASSATRASWKDRVVRLTPVAQGRVEAYIKNRQERSLRAYGEPLSAAQVEEARKWGAQTNAYRLDKMHRKGFRIDVAGFKPLPEENRKEFRQCAAGGDLVELHDLEKCAERMLPMTFGHE